MTDIEKMIGRSAADVAFEAAEIGNDIIDFLQSSGVRMDVGVFAAGMAFASGAQVMGLSLPHTIDLVRIFYRANGASHEADE